MAGLCTRWSPKASGGPLCGGCARVGTAGRTAISQRISGWLRSAKADLGREYLRTPFATMRNSYRGDTVVLTVSASLVLTLSAARTHERSHERSERVQVPAPAVERAPQVQAGGVSPRRQHPPWSLRERGRARRPTGAEPR